MIIIVFIKWDSGGSIRYFNRRYVIEVDTMVEALERAERWIFVTKGIREVYFQVANDKIHIMAHDDSREMYTLGYIREEVAI